MGIPTGTGPAFPTWPSLSELMPPWWSIRAWGRRAEILSFAKRKSSARTRILSRDHRFSPGAHHRCAVVSPGSVWIVPEAQKADIAASTTSYIQSFMSRSADLTAALKT